MFITKEIRRTMIGRIIQFSPGGALLLLLLLPGQLHANFQRDGQCIVEDDGTGTVELPPNPCAYIAPSNVFEIIDGLPPGTTIELEPVHLAFICRELGNCGTPGGNLGGEVETFDSTLVFRAKGTGALDGFRRILMIPLASQTHSAPRTPGDPVQTFDREWFSLMGALSPGDPDFAQLQIIAGSAFGLPSPGFTALTDLGDGTFHVDSFFDITYQIDFIGAPGSALEGLGGSTQNTVRMEIADNRDPCIVKDDGTGTIKLPPDGCENMTLEEMHEIIDGLPPGTTIELSARYRKFFCPSGDCGSPGGNLGGEVESFDSTLVLELEGTGTLSDFRRTLRMPTSVVTHSGPRTPGNPVQIFPIDLFSMQGSIANDPDFSSFQITSGTGNGLPSPGYVMLTDQGNGTFLVDSFFDIAYEIDFEGAPGGALEGLSGLTTSTSGVSTIPSPAPCIAFDNGTGTVMLPPENCENISLSGLMMIIDGLPPGTTIELSPRWKKYLCQGSDCGTTGGNLGGEKEIFTSVLELEMTGTGSLTGFKRTIELPATAETHSGPRTPGDSVQRFDTDIFDLQGSLAPGDPDFDQLTITAGTKNSLPSPGSTTLTDRNNDTFYVDSFFDITYQISFTGAPGGALDGLSGATQASVRLSAVSGEKCYATHNNGSTVYSSSDGSALQDAVDSATAGDTVKVAGLCVGASDKSGADPVVLINKNLTIQGGYVKTNWLTADPVANPTILDADNLGRVISISGSPTVALVNLTINNGNEENSDGGGIYNPGGALTINNSTISGNVAFHGGGIYNQGTIILAGTLIKENSTTGEGSGIYNDGGLTITDSTLSSNTIAVGGVHRGGGIYSTNTGTLNINRSLLMNNEAHSVLGEGGGLYIAGTGSIANSTFSGNSTIGAAPSSYGGGVYISSTGNLTMTNCTVSGNTATSGGGISNAGTLHLKSTIIANSISGGDCVNTGTLGTNSKNLVEDGSCSPYRSGDPKLGPLRDNGGETATMALLPGSFAINVIPTGTNGCGTTIATDQRGETRPQGSKCDIGAFEAESVFPWIIFYPAFLDKQKDDENDIQ